MRTDSVLLCFLQFFERDLFGLWLLCYSDERERILIESFCHELVDVLELLNGCSGSRDAGCAVLGVVAARVEEGLILIENVHDSFET